MLIKALLGTWEENWDLERIVPCPRYELAGGRARIQAQLIQSPNLILHQDMRLPLLGMKKVVFHGGLLHVSHNLKDTRKKNLQVKKGLQRATANKD